MNPSLTLARGDSQPDTSLLRRLSVSYRRTVGGCSQMIYNRTVGIPARMEGLLAKLVQFGGRELAGKIVARFHAIVQGRTPEPLSANLKLDAQRVDADEEVAQLAYELDPSDVNLERYARSEEKQAYTSTELAMSLRAEQRKRAGRV